MSTPHQQWPQTLTERQRADILTQYLHHLAGQGQRVVDRHATSATVLGPKYHLSAKTHWLLSPLHVALALCTCGVYAVIALRLWGPWAVKRYRHILVDEQGHISTQMVRAVR